MLHEDLLKRIDELEREIALLPEGSVTKKKVKGKDYYYHRINKNGKRSEKYISFDEMPILCAETNKRKELEKELKMIKMQTEPQRDIARARKNNYTYKTTVRMGKELKSQISLVSKYKKRKCYQELREYIFGESQEKVFIIYGLRRTGKTTMIRQILAELPDSEFKKAAFIQIKSKDTLADIDSDLKLLESIGYKYVFIDEITLMENFIESAAIFSDIYASSGMKIVLSGTDSLGFLFSKEEQLYDRCIMLHTTFIPYREFEEVLGIRGIDEYIRYGGTMSLSGINYNKDSIFASPKNAEEYIDTAIAKNIQHSLSMYQYGGHFRQLLDLYEKGELTNVINRVVENINHSFTRNVVEKTFKSHDISVTAANLLRDKRNPINLNKHLDIDAVTFGIMQMLDILNKEEQSVDISEAHMAQIKEYLSLLDLIMDIDLESLPDVSQSEKLCVVSQPGIRYAQAGAILKNMILDEKFQELSAVQRQQIVERLLSEIRGRMMEEIILLETMLARKDRRVFKLQFAVGEFDMVVYNQEKLNCEIFEVKYSTEQVPEQYRHITDKEKCDMTAHRYGEIIGRYVIYRGPSARAGDVQYLNVEDYLKSL